ncbi:MAG: hypothetical protein OQK77_04970 [Psychromonas sp.]|nr:hypothetical protein [Psychromonas sp.]
MSLAKEFLVQFKKFTPVLAPTYIVLLGLLFSVAVISVRYNIPVAEFTRDPTVILGGDPFTGFISNIGIIFWCFTAAICFFSSAVYRTYLSGIVSLFLKASGMLTLWLLLDDLFMFHDSLFPKYLHVSEKIVYLGYLVLISLYFLKFKEVIVKTEYPILFMACSFFALSVLSDVFLPQKGWEFLFEDGFKLLGIVTWFIFFTRVCFIQIQEVKLKR